MLISQKMASEIENIIGLCFVGNRLIDRMKSQLNVKFVMPITGNIVHKNMAHKLPLLADELGDYLESRDYSEGYPLTPADFTEYETSREIFERILEYFLDLEGCVSDVISKAIEERDYLTSYFLQKFLYEVCEYTVMAKALVDYSIKNDCTPKDDMRYDANVEDFLEVSSDD